MQKVAPWVSKLSFAMVIGISLAVVVYWLWVGFGGKNYFTALTIIKFNTTLSMLLSGLAAMTLDRPSSRLLKTARYVLAIVVIFFGAWTLLEYVFPLFPSIDNWLFRDMTVGIQDYPGRMSPNAALSFVIIGYLLLLIDTQKPRNFNTIQALTYLIVSISALSIAGYIFKTEALYGISQATRMSLLASGEFVLLSVGILTLFPSRGFLAAFFGSGIAARMLRQILPIAIIAPILFEWAEKEGLELGLYDHAYGDVLMSLSITLVMILVVIWSSKSIEKLELEKKRVAALVELNEARMKSVLDNTPAVVFIKDADQKYLLVNKQYETLFHVTNESIHGKTDHDIFPKEHADRFVEADQKVLRTGEALQLEEIVPQDDGEHTYVATKFPMWDPVRQQRVVCGIATDITLKKRAEEKMLEVAKIKSDFALMVSHELRAPLTLIKGSIELVEDEVLGKVTPEQKNHLGVALHNVDRLDRLIGSVLDYQKLEGGQIKYRIYPNDIESDVMETVNGFRTIIEKKGLQFVVNIPKSLPPVMVDKDALIQVVTNLLSNAIKFTDDGTIAISAKQCGDQVEISVIDNGIGISKEDQPRLFQSFSRIDTGGRRTQGTGLGLAICRKIIERHGGTIGVRSIPSEGSVFFFTLPVASQPTTSAT